MIKDNMLDKIAENAIRTWFLLWGFIPTEWNNDDPCCVRNNTNHRIYYMEATIPEHLTIEVQSENLGNSLCKYLKAIKQINSDANFALYSLELYTCTCCDCLHICISIYN